MVGSFRVMGVHGLISGQLIFRKLRKTVQLSAKISGFL